MIRSLKIFWSSYGDKKADLPLSQQLVLFSNQSPGYVCTYILNEECESFILIISQLNFDYVWGLEEPRMLEIPEAHIYVGSLKEGDYLRIVPHGYMRAGLPFSTPVSLKFNAFLPSGRKFHQHWASLTTSFKQNWRWAPPLSRQKVLKCTYDGLYYIL